MKIKLYDYIRDNINLFDNNTVICYVDNKTNPSFIEYSLFLDEETNFIILRYNSITRIDYYDTLDNNLLTSLYADVEIDTDKICIFTHNEWIKFKKKLIKKSISFESFHHKDLYNFCKNNGGKLIKYDDELWMFIGVSSTDEDYYYVLVSHINNVIRFRFITCCHRLEDFIDDKKYGIEERELLAFISKNKNEIVKKVNEFENDVMISGVNFGQTKQHHKRHKNTALNETFEHCNSFFDRPSKCIEVLKDILLKLNNQKINSNVVKLLNAYIAEYGTYYKPLDRQLKGYYRKIFTNNLKNILNKYNQKIGEEKVVSYVTNVCKTLNKSFFKDF